MRIIFILFLYLCYGGVSIYLNYYYHDINNEATVRIFDLHKRNIYTTELDLFIKQALPTGQKELVGHNKGIYCII